jgi:cellobiose phosphorylase
MERMQQSHFARNFFFLRARLLPIARPIIAHNADWRDCMRKAVFAGAVALAIMGPLLVSEHGIGPSPASAQDVVVTEGKIARLRSALRLSAEQLQHWRPVEAALRAAIREQRGENGGWVHKVRDRVGSYAGGAMALQRAASVAGPLLASLDENQKRSGMTALRSIGGAALF